MAGDGGVDEVAAQRAQPREYSILIRACKPRVAHDVSDQDRCQFPRLAHGAGAEVARSPSRGCLSMVRFHAALKRTWKQGAHPRVSTGRSIHAAFEHIIANEGGTDDAAVGRA